MLMDITMDQEERDHPLALRDGTPFYQRFFTVRRSLPAEWVRLFTHVDYRH